MAGATSLVLEARLERVISTHHFPTIHCTSSFANRELNCSAPQRTMSQIVCWSPNTIDDGGYVQEVVACSEMRLSLWFHLALHSNTAPLTLYRPHLRPSTDVENSLTLENITVFLI